MIDKYTKRKCEFTYTQIYYTHIYKYKYVIINIGYV